MNRFHASLSVLACCLAAGSLAVAADSPSIQPSAATAVLFDHEQQQVDCDSAQLTGPVATSTAHLTGADSISLDVLLMLDIAQGVQIEALGIDTPEYLAAGEEAYQAVLDLLEVAPSSYDPLGIELNWVGWELLAPTDEAGAVRDRTTETQEIIDLAKVELGGVRPDGVDVVYVATDLDVQALGQTAVAGQADCIGGVGNDDAAFAVGEIGDGLVHPKDGIPIGPVTFYRDFAAKVAAHEIGHLMGGHHHYQECGTPGPLVSAAGRSEIGGCTLMSNAVDFQSLPFSTLNGVVVRGHAEAFADR